MLYCLWVAGELNLLDSDLDADTTVRHTWSPGSLKYYGRAELQASDHRYGPRCLGHTLLC